MTTAAGRIETAFDCDASEPRPLTDGGIVADGGRRAALDGFRGLAVLMVVVGHSGVADLARFATSGVSLFFVLSGFLITALLVREAASGAIGLSHFYVRRLLRVGPALVVCVAAVLLWARLDTTVSAPSVPTLLLANVSMGQGRSLGLLAHTWSLAMEEQFYVVWPVVLMIALRRSRRTATAVASIGAALSLAIAVALVIAHEQGAHWERVRFSPDTRAYGLLVGCALALALPAMHRRWLRVLHLLVVPALVACVIASTRTGESAVQYLVWRPVVTVAGAIIIVTLLDDARPISRIASWRPLRYVGRISYALYLWHFPVDGIIAVRLASAPWWWRTTLATCISVAVASLSYHALERPFLRLQVRFRVTSGLAGARRSRPEEVGTDT